jgi:hypothetical protein
MSGSAAVLRSKSRRVILSPAVEVFVTTNDPLFQVLALIPPDVVTATLNPGAARSGAAMHMAHAHRPGTMADDRRIPVTYVEFGPGASGDCATAAG